MESEMQTQTDLRYQMPARKVGRLWKFQLNEVDAWVRSRESASTQGHNRAQ